VILVIIAFSFETTGIVLEELKWKYFVSLCNER